MVVVGVVVGVVVIVVVIVVVVVVVVVVAVVVVTVVVVSPKSYWQTVATFLSWTLGTKQLLSCHQKLPD